MAEVEFVRWAIFGILGIAMWFLRKTITDTEEKIKKLETDIDLVKRDYIHKEEFREWKTEIRGFLEEIRKDVRAIRNEKS